MSQCTWWRNSVGSAAAALALGGIFVAAGLVGCKSNPPNQSSQSSPSAQAAEPEMSDAKLRAVTAADAVISQGEKERADGEQLRSQDREAADRMVKQGEDDIARGTAMRSQAAGMK